MGFIFPTHRALPLDGGDGYVMCRMHLSETSGTTPKKSRAERIECATRSLLRMKNLAAVRGYAGRSMVGPADYYTNLEKPDESHYTIQINGGIPEFTEIKTPVIDNNASNFIPLDECMMTRVAVNWVNGRDKDAIRKTKAHYASANPAFGESLFPNPGILEIKTNSDCVNLPSVDFRNVDLSSFKARLVPNDAPFQITAETLPENDEYRAVSFLYEPGYAQNQINQGGGLFLETHDFSQTMTPLDSQVKGFVTLGRWNDTQDALDLIAVQIPYGYTLIIDRDCIHGDATLNGMFMMCMTTNHVTMQTANSVFLKHPLTKKNITLSTTDLPEPLLTTLNAPRPYVLYNTDSKEQLNTLVTRMNKWDLIFNPLSMGYWKLSTHRLSPNAILQIVGGMLTIIGAATLVSTLFLPLSIVILPALIALATVSTVVGLGLFAYGTTKKIQETIALNQLPTEQCMGY